MEYMTVACPKCSSRAFKRNGFTRHGKQNHRCLDCGRQFSLEPEVNFVFEVAAQQAQENFAEEERELNAKTLVIS
jgi:transposase-like protein